MAGKRKKQQVTSTSKSKKTTRCNKNIQLHQDSEPEEEEQEEAKEESQEEAQEEEDQEEEEAVDNEDDDGDDDDNEEEDSNNEDTTKLPSQGNKATKRTRRQQPHGLGYTQEETETLLSCIHEVIPIGPQDWENVLFKHNQHFTFAISMLQSTFNNTLFPYHNHTEQDKGKMPNMKQRKWFPPLERNQVSTNPKQDVALSSRCHPALFLTILIVVPWGV